MSAPLVAAESIVVERAGRCVVDGVSVALAPCEVLTIAGASGSGKSTLLRALGLLEPLASGVIEHRGRRIEPREVTAYRRKIAYVAQSARMFAGSVADNVRAGPGFFGASLDDAGVARHLDAVGLAPSFAERPAAELSGGEGLRVSLARALANEPEALLLDEPTASLDAESAAHVLDMLRGLAARGVALMMVTHAREHAARLGGRALSMVEGRLIPTGNAP